MKAKHYIVQIVGFEGEDANLTVELHCPFTDEEGEELIFTDDGEGEEDSYIYAILQVDADGASIVDNGYRSIEEAKAAWPTAIEPSQDHLVHGGAAFTAVRRDMSHIHIETCPECDMPIDECVRETKCNAIRRSKEAVRS